jgi:hypothetical protein
MSQESEPSDARLDAPTSSDIEALELFRRSPHPYLRHKDEIRKPSPERLASSSRATRNRPNPPSRTISDADGRKRRKTSSRSQSPSESGTEADDEGYSFVRALPPPPLRPHKGLRDTEGSVQGALSPLLTPTQIDDEGRKFSDGYFNGKKRGNRKGEPSFTDEEARSARQKYLKRRRNELVRRTTETALLAGIGILAVTGCNCWQQLLVWHRGEHHRLRPQSWTRLTISQQSW